MYSFKFSLLIQNYTLSINTSLTWTHRQVFISWRELLPHVFSSATRWPCHLSCYLTATGLSPLPASDQTNGTSISEIGLYEFLLVTNSLASLVRLILILLMKNFYFPNTLTYFVGLATGTLFSNALSQLISEAFGFNNYVKKVAAALGELYMIFFLDRILKMSLNTQSEWSYSLYKWSGPPQEKSSTA